MGLQSIEENVRYMNLFPKLYYVKNMGVRWDCELGIEELRFYFHSKDYICFYQIDIVDLECYTND